MRRWLVLSLGLAVALAAAYALLTGPSDLGQPRDEVTVPGDDIDQASREKLREILRQADRDEAR